MRLGRRKPFIIVMQKQIMNLAKAKAILSAHKNELYEKFSIKGIRIFGSYVRGEQKKGSDIDLLADYAEVPSLFELVDAQDYLSGLLGRKVDLVPEGCLKPRIAANVMKEAVGV